MWIARDKNGTLTLFENKPVRVCDIWAAEGHRYMYLNEDMFQEITWRSDAAEVELIFKKI